MFLLGTTLAGWHAARQEFNALYGSTPLLPDWAFGTWFTFWHSYSYTEAAADVLRWESDHLPLDVWGLDMNWRNVTSGQDGPTGATGNPERHYNHPNTTLFPNFTEWFQFLKAKGLKTYFNDHPYQMDMQLSQEEVNFRWKGLTGWLEKGLNFWWFDKNWGQSIGPPFVNTTLTAGDWMGLDNAAWGSHYYHSVSERYNSKAGSGRPIALTKYAAREPWRLCGWTGNKCGPNGEYPPVPGPLAASPAQRRYPVWWTGDSVQLDAAVQSTVDSGVHGLKPYVHSDCGGDGVYHGDVAHLRWTAHCVLSTILRFHGADHRPWHDGAGDNVTVTGTEDTVRKYLQMRYTLIPSLIAAGQQVTQHAFPLVARLDLFWPEHPQASSNMSYLFLNDTLVAPIVDMGSNVSTRSVWIPPGEWQDGWNGSVVTGPRVAQVTQPYDRIPLWHRRGSFTATTSRPGTRVASQDWSELTLEIFPDSAVGASTTSTSNQVTVRKQVHERDSADAMTMLEMETGGSQMTMRVSAGPGQLERGWCLRVHLRPGQRVVAAEVDGRSVALDDVETSKLLAGPNSTNVLSHIDAASHGTAHFPFAGAGSAPAFAAGPVAELTIERAAIARVVTMFIGQEGAIKLLTIGRGVVVPE